MTLHEANVNWQGIPQNEMKFSDIEDEFGQNTGRSLGAYRVSQSIGDLSRKLDEDDCGINENGDIPSSGEISFSDFYNSRLNVVVDYHSGGDEWRPQTAKDRYNGKSLITVVGGFKSKSSVPTDAKDTKMIIHVNKGLGSAKDRQRSSSQVHHMCALRTGTPDSSCKMQIDVGSNGKIIGSGGDGGNGQCDGSNGQGGGHGSSGLGIQFGTSGNKVKVILDSSCYVAGGSGGGGGGGGGYDTDKHDDELGCGGGGGGGAGYPGGLGGAGAASWKRGGTGKNGTNATSYTGGTGGAGGNADNEGIGGDGGDGGGWKANAEPILAEPGGDGSGDRRATAGGARGGYGAAIRHQSSSAYREVIGQTNTNTKGSTDAIGVL